MPALVDTTVRLLGQEPLAGRLPTSEQIRIGAILDQAGFAYLEVSGGGCFDNAVRRGVESPWERIRSLKARIKTPLGLALRGRLSSARARSTTTSSGGSSPPRQRTASTSSGCTIR
jgi:pyruvate/oxaloacetate carboxyltransferase